MTTFLFSMLGSGADRIARTDPHGFTLSIIAVTVVFLCLLLLFAAYTLMGDLNTGKFKRAPKKPVPAQDAPQEDELHAAIATALHLYISENLHDRESGIITIAESSGRWADKSLTLRRKTILK